MNTQSTRIDSIARTDQQIVEHYIAEAHRLRSEAIRGMVHDAAARLRRAFSHDVHGSGRTAHGAA